MSKYLRALKYNPKQAETGGNSTQCIVLGKTHIYIPSPGGCSPGHIGCLGLQFFSVCDLFFAFHLSWVLLFTRNVLIHSSLFRLLSPFKPCEWPHHSVNPFLTLNKLSLLWFSKGFKVCATLSLLSIHNFLFYYLSEQNKPTLLESNACMYCHFFLLSFPEHSNLISGFGGALSSLNMLGFEVQSVCLGLNSVSVF